MAMTRALRDHLVDVASSYLDALITHDAARARLAQDVRRATNGKHGPAGAGADALRAVIEREPVAEMSELRFVVDPPHVAVVYGLEADMTRATQSETFAPRHTWIPAYVAERFTVVEGLITE